MRISATGTGKLSLLIFSQAQTHRRNATGKLFCKIFLKAGIKNLGKQGTGISLILLGSMKVGFASKITSVTSS